jgi:Ring finger domain
MRPLSEQELRKIKLEKAPVAPKKKPKQGENPYLTEGNGNEICSICCDEIAPKALVRRMPECKHMFHQKCIDNWLKMKPTCPNCNRKTRELIKF